MPGAWLKEMDFGHPMEPLQPGFVIFGKKSPIFFMGELIHRL